jgi:hypothetical protein
MRASSGLLGEKPEGVLAPAADVWAASESLAGSGGGDANHDSPWGAVSKRDKVGRWFVATEGRPVPGTVGIHERIDLEQWGAWTVKGGAWTVSGQSWPSRDTGAEHRPSRTSLSSQRSVTILQRTHPCTSCGTPAARCPWHALWLMGTREHQE